MAEALVAIEVAGAISEVVQSLYSYISAVKSAKDEIRKLTQELFALKGALEHFDAQSKSGVLGAAVAEEVQGMLRMTHDAIGGIQKKLGLKALSLSSAGIDEGGASSSKPSRARSAVAALAWPFRQGDIDKYLITLERAKTWFIMVIMRDTTETTGAIYAEVQRLSTTMHEDIISRRADQMIKEANEVIKWLAPVSAADELEKASSTRVPGTGQWIWDGDFAAWEDSPKTEMPIFWIMGKSGSGKTVLFSSLVDEMRLRCATDKAVRKAVGFHCCSLDNAATQPVNSVFGSVLAQVTAQRPELVEHLQPIRKTGTKLIPQNNLTVHQIHTLMKVTLEMFDSFYILVDALNETPHDGIILNTLVSLCEKHPNLRVLITSIRDPPPDSTLTYVRRMNQGVIDLDIETYVQQRLLTEPAFRSLTPTSRNEVRTRIVGGSHGVFRWAKLCMDRLGTYRTGRDIKLALKDIPTTLHETYAATIARIPDNDREIAREALMWLCFSLRPLHLVELAEAVVLREDDTFLDDDSRFTDPAVVLEICQGLVYSSHDEVTLAHDSIRTFLLSDWIRTSSASSFALDPSESHRKIMRKCLTYLSLRSFASGPAHSHLQLQILFREFPLLRYASQLWPIHSESCGALNGEDEARILEFFATKSRPDSGAFGSWVQFLLESLDLRAIKNTEPLYYAASYNMVSITKLLLRPGSGVQVDKRGGRHWSTPLFVAVWRGNLEVAKLLWRAGANPYIRDSVGYNSLEMADRNDLGELAEEIREAGQDRRGSEDNARWEIV